MDAHLKHSFIFRKYCVPRVLRLLLVKIARIANKNERKTGKQTDSVLSFVCFHSSVKRKNNFYQILEKMALSKRQQRNKIKQKHKHVFCLAQRMEERQKNVFVCVYLYIELAGIGMCFVFSDEPISCCALFSFFDRTDSQYSVEFFVSH